MLMKGYVLNGAQNIELKEFDLQCGDDDVIIKNLVSSVCGSDLYSYFEGGESRGVKLGAEFGHETVSEIIEVGKNVQDLKVGQRVYPFPLFTKKDTRRAGCIGAFSEMILVENAKLNHNLYLVDDSISDSAAALMEPYTVGFRSAVLTQPKEGQNAIVYGAGAVGIAAAICLKVNGVDKIAVIDKSDFRLEMARGLGFYGVNNKKNEKWKEELIEYFGPGRNAFGPAPNVQIQIDAIGDADLFADAYAMAPLFSTISVVGVHHKPAQIDLMKLTYRTLKLVGSGGYMPDNVPMVMDMMKSHIFDIESTVSHTFAFKDLQKALETANVPENARKVQIDFRL